MLYTACQFQWPCSLPFMQIEVHMWERLNLSAQQLMSQGKHSEAESYFRQSLLEAEKEFGTWDNRVATVLNNLGNCLRVQGRSGEAEPIYQRALDVRRKALGPLHKEELMILENYAKVLRALNKESEAKKLEQAAMGIMRRN